MSELRNTAAPRWDPDKAFRELRLGSPFRGRISFGDVDTETEIKRNFLVVEGKREFDDGRLEQMSQGQVIAMGQRRLDGRTIVIIWGYPETNEIRWMQHYGQSGVATADWPRFWRFCRAWADWARLNPNPVERISGFEAHVAALRAAA